MSSIAASPVIEPGGVTLVGGSGEAPVVTPLYTINPNEPERIESVYFEIPYASAEPQFDLFALQLCAQDGAVLDEIPAPDITALDGSDLVVVLSWARLGEDTAKEGFFVHNDLVSGWSRMWANLRLPDFVMQPSGVVNLLSWTNYNNEFPPIVIPAVYITTTRNAGAVSTTTPVALTPFLLPAAGS